MFCIVGLGNSEKHYHTHRHNVGFMFVDYLSTSLHHLPPFFKHDETLQSELVKSTFDNKELLLVKPMTFMNKSGVAVAKLFQTYKLKMDDLVVVHDDLDIPLGKFKINRGVGPKLHNGIKSIEEYLGTHDFWRVRIGVENRPVGHAISGEAYVLEDFMDDERTVINSLFPEIWKRVNTDLLL